MDAATLFLGEARTRKPLPEETLRELIRQAQEGDREARAKVVLANMRLAFYVAKRFHRPGSFLELGDLLQQAGLGLLLAIDKFNLECYSRGRRVRFATYAYYWIAHAVRREWQKQERLITLSLDWESPESDRDRPCREPSDPRDNPEEEAARREARRYLHRLLEQLPNREALIVSDRFALRPRDGRQTLHQVSLGLGVSSERVRQLEKQAFRRMRALTHPPPSAVSLCAAPTIPFN